MSGLARGSRLAAIPFLVLLILALAAALPALGSAPPAPPSPGAVYETALGALAILGGLFALAVIAICAWALWGPPPSRRQRRPPAPFWLRTLIVVGVLYGFIAFSILRHQRFTGIGGAGAAVAPVRAAGGGPASVSLFDWASLSVAAGALVLLMTVLVVRALARRNRRVEAAPTEELAAAAEEGLEELRSIGDPRTAVIRAYAAMERLLARRGFARRPHEAPTEYLARLVAGTARVQPARRLTSLYEEARFSRHPVGEEMKEEAVTAFEALRGPA